MIFNDRVRVIPALRGATRDSRGNIPVSWPPEGAYWLEGVAVGPGSSNETTERGRAEQAVDTAAVYVEDRDESRIDQRDRIEWNGYLWEVQGRPQVWRDAFSGAVMGTVVQIQAVTGG